MRKKQLRVVRDMIKDNIATLSPNVVGNLRLILEDINFHLTVTSNYAIVSLN